MEDDWETIDSQYVLISNDNDTNKDKEHIAQLEYADINLSTYILSNDNQSLNNVNTKKHDVSPNLLLVETQYKDNRGGPETHKTNEPTLTVHQHECKHIRKNENSSNIMIIRQKFREKQIAEVYKKQEQNAYKMCINKTDIYGETDEYEDDDCITLFKIGIKYVNIIL